MTNVRSFGKASLWGSIGGFVGMILGLSFLQVPDIINSILHYMQRRKIVVNDSSGRNDTENVSQPLLERQETTTELLSATMLKLERAFSFSEEPF